MKPSQSPLWREFVLASHNDTSQETNSVNNAIKTQNSSLLPPLSLFASFWQNFRDGNINIKKIWFKTHYCQTTCRISCHVECPSIFTASIMHLLRLFSQPFIKIHPIIRGAPDPEFCYPTGSWSGRIQTSTTDDNRRKITLSQWWALTNFF